VFIGKRAFLRSTRSNMIGTPSVSGAAEAAAWQAAVIANGGTVSAGRLAVVSSFIAAEKSAGTWALTDDYWGLWGENAPQALTSLKQLRLCTAVAAPTFTADRGYVFNGTTQYLDSGFVPSTHAVAMTGSNLRAAAYERTNVTTSTYVLGAGGDDANSNVRFIPRTASSTMQAALNSALTNHATGITDSRGYSAASRSGSTYATYKNGVSAGSGVPGTTGTTLTVRSIFIGATNSAGVAGTFRAASVGLIAVGGTLSAPQELAQYTNVQAWATAVGANV
jgi:hypothetical protein